MSIRTARSHGVATIEIDRPAKRNALTAQMYEALVAALKDAAQDHAVRAVLLTGQPGIFTSGNDLEDFLHRPPGPDSPLLAFMRGLVEFEKPVIAAVTGPAIGIGTTLLLHCDLVYVADDARLQMPFTNLGLVAEFASSLVLPVLLGNARAAEKLLLGDPFTGADAVECGIANAVLPSAEVVPHARRMAERFNALPPGAVRETKWLMRRAQRQAVLEAITAEATVFARRLGSPEAREAMQAFLERRPADFSRFS